MATYHVMWEIDIEADDAGAAAQQALEIQRDPNSTATVFEVRLHTDVFHVDLSLGEDQPER